MGQFNDAGDRGSNSALRTLSGLGSVMAVAGIILVIKGAGSPTAPVDYAQLYTGCALAAFSVQVWILLLLVWAWRWERRSDLGLRSVLLAQADPADRGDRVLAAASESKRLNPLQRAAGWLLSPNDAP